MAIEFRGREEFLKEIYEYKEANDTTIIESIAEYQKKYDLDEEYIVKNLFSPTLYEKLKKEAVFYNLIKKEKSDELFGI